MGRSILAVIAGYLTLIVGVSGALAFAAFVLLGEIPMAPGAYEGPAYFLWVELAISGLVAVAGGYVCAFVARRQEMKHVAALAGLVLVMAVVSLFAEQGRKPTWSSLAVPAVGLLGLWLGGRLRVRHRED